VATVFAAFLGYNPVAELLGPHIHEIPMHQVAALTNRSPSSRPISDPFSSSLSVASTFAFIACPIAAGASWPRGGSYHDSGDTDVAPRSYGAADIELRTVVSVDRAPA